MKCLDCKRGHYIEKEVKWGSKMIMVETCNNCGADFS